MTGRDPGSAPFQRGALFLALIATLLVALTHGQAMAAEPQRMRLPVGSYWLAGGGGSDIPSGHVALGSIGPGGGGSFSLPAYCIDRGRAAPTSKTDLTAFSGNVEIRQYSQGVLLATKTLAEATRTDPKSGQGPWITVSGEDEIDLDGDIKLDDQGQILGSASSIAIKPNDPKYDYAIVVNSLAIAGHDSTDVQTAFDRWHGNQDLMEISGAFDNLRQILASTPDLSDLVEQARQDYEWHQFGKSKQGAQIPEQGADKPSATRSINEKIQQDFNFSSWGAPLSPRPELTASDRRDWITFMTAGRLTDTQTAQLSQAFSTLGVEIDSTPQVLDQATKRLVHSAYDVSMVDKLRIVAEQEESQEAANQGSVIDMLRLASRTMKRSTSVREIMPRFYYARKLQGRSFAEALQFSTLDRFTPAEIASGQVDLGPLGDLHCAEGLNTDWPLAREALAVATIPRLQELAKLLAILPVQLHTPRKIKVSADDEAICFQWLDDTGQLITKKIKRGDLSKDAIASMGAVSFLVNSTDDSIVDLLQPLGADVQTIQEAQLAAAAATIRIPARKPGKQPDFIVESLKSHQMKAGEVPTEVAILNLKANGDAGILRLADGSLMLVDTGLDDDIVPRLGAFLARNYGAKIPPIKLLITHAHEDHIGGLSAILAAGYHPDEIIIGRSVKDKDPDVLEDLRKTMKSLKYEADDTDSITQFVRPGVTPLINLSTPTFRAGSVEAFILHPNERTSISLYHVRGAKEPNDAGFVLKLINDKTSWLLADDLSPKSMKTMLFSLPRSELSAEYLKWPHHLWFPNSQAPDRIVLREFLKSVGAHTYVFSNKGHYTHTEDRYKEIDAFLKYEFGEHVNTLWTTDWKGNLVLRGR